MQFLILKILRFYQLIISFFKPHSCRFIPTCSEYAVQAFLLHGTLKGAILTIKRISRCHPWGKSGYDPVPSLTKKGNKYAKTH